MTAQLVRSALWYLEYIIFVKSQKRSFKKMTLAKLSRIGHQDEAMAMRLAERRAE